MTCLLRFPLSLNDLSHSVHWKGLSEVEPDEEPVGVDLELREYPDSIPDFALDEEPSIECDRFEDDSPPRVDLSEGFRMNSISDFFTLLMIL